MSPKDAVRQFLSRFDPSRPLAVAVSGGSDSTALLDLLAGARNDGRVSLQLAITVDHGLRAGSDAEADEVTSWCAELDVDHVTVRWEGAKPATGLQNAARLARYRLIREAALARDIDCVATAHTQDDQIETVRMRGGRSAGRGLSGMAETVLYHRDFWILRPLLHVPRAGLRQHLQYRGRSWIDDPSNDDRRFERVRVRRAILEDGYDNEAIAIAGRARTRMQDAARIALVLKDTVSVHQGAVAKFRMSPVDGGDIRGVLSVLLAIIGGRQHLPGTALMDRVMDFAEDAVNGRMTAGGCVIDRRGSALFLYRENRNLPTLRLAAGESALWDGRYTVTNREPVSSITIGPAGRQGHTSFAGADFSSLPAGVVRRTIATLPVCRHAESGDDRMPTVEIRRFLAPFDLFLPDFDMIVARTCAGLFGLPDYPDPPLHTIGGAGHGFN